MELIAIVGPTASGKTHKAVALAKRIGGEIISADSRQLYRGMDIGTGKDLEEYGTVPYHLIDICPAGYKYNLYEYLRDCDKAVAEIRQRGNQPIVCGGTGLYVESYLKGVRLPEVPENKALRERLEAYTLEDLTAMLAEMKTLHNTTDVDTKKRAIRAIEIHLQKPVYHSVRITADRRSEMSIELECKTIVTYVVSTIASLGHRTQCKHFDSCKLRLVLGLSQESVQCLCEFSSILSLFHLISEVPGKRPQTGDLFTIRFIMDTIYESLR